DPAKYVYAALSPAKVDRVLIDEENRCMEVIVPDDQLSLAIGRNGQNVRLAVKLTGWKIDVKSESSSAQQEEDSRTDMTVLPDMSEAIAEGLLKEGITSLALIAAADVETLMTVPGVSREQAESWIQAATRMIEEAAVAGE
ncbi:MAG: helix-hairpin-helix domain-containing protein, partial [Syntrophales bacterium]|nr:helix-hairpin-helix domain-containing protein [Syntrophales bacterium]